MKTNVTLEGHEMPMLQAITDPMSLLDRELTIIWTNDAAKRMFGTEIVGRKCYEVYHGRTEPCEPSPCLALRSFQDGHMHEHDTQARTAMGEIVHFHCTANVALRDADGNPTGVIEISRNVTEQKQAEQAVRQSEEKYRTLFDSAKDHIMIFALDGRLVSANPAAMEHLRITGEDQLASMTVADILPEHQPDGTPSREKVREMDAIAVAEGAVSFEIQVKRMDGTTFPGEVQVTKIQLGEDPFLLVRGMDITERKQAEEVLRESENKYRTLLENLPQRIFHKDRNSVYVSCNRNYARDLDIDPAEIVGKTDYDFFPKELAEKYRTDDHRIMVSGKTQHIDEKYMQDGQEFTVHTFKTPVRGEGGEVTGTLGAFWDVTARAKGLKALKESEARYRTLWDSSRDALATVAPKEAKFISANPAAVKLFGFRSEEDLLTTNIAGLSPEFQPDGRPTSEAAPDMIRKTLETGFHSFEWLHQRPNGEKFFVSVHLSKTEIDGRLVLQSSMRDITEQKKAGAEIAELKQELEYILGAAKTGLDIIDADFNIRYIDPEWQKAYGDPTGRKCYEYFMDRSEVCPGCGIVQALETKSPAVTEEILVKENNRPVQVTTIPFQNHEGEWLVAEVNVDISERKQMDEALRQRTEALERSNTELQQFAYVASHDLQEPLRMVASYVQLLERRYKDQLDEAAQEFIDFAVDGAKRMQGLINALLEYSRVGTRAREFVPTDCNAVFANTLRGLEMAIEEKHAQVTVESLPTVPADDIQMGQIFQNLIGNALKFHTGDDPRVHVSAARDNGMWVFSVQDNGIGMDPKYAERIFSVFQRLHNRGEYPGAGIGLAVCKKIVERHGGRIWVESAPGAGSTFHFTIPAAEEQS